MKRWYSDVIVRFYSVPTQSLEHVRLKTTQIQYTINLSELDKLVVVVVHKCLYFFFVYILQMYFLSDVDKVFYSF